MVSDYVKYAFAQSKAYAATEHDIYMLKHFIPKIRRLQSICQPT